MLTSLVKSVVASFCRGSNQNETFAVKPYLQLGSNSDELTLLWFSAIGRKYWTAEYRIGSNSPWEAVDVKAGKKKKVKLNGLSVRKFSVALPMNSNAGNCSELAEDPQYRILIDGVSVFSSSFRIPKIADQSRVVVFGDFGDGNQAASEVAAAVHERNPEMIVLAGDLVYDHGRNLRIFQVLLSGSQCRCYSQRYRCTNFALDSYCCSSWKSRCWYAQTK
jgi:hypothetical protein